MLSIIRSVVQVLDSIPSGLGTLSLGRLHYVRYHPQIDEKCLGVFRGVILKDKYLRGLAQLVGATVARMLII